MMKLERVVVGIDFSESSIAAAEWTAHHFAPGAELVLVYAIRIPEPPGFLRGGFPSSEGLVETARRGAEIRLRELTQSLGAKQAWIETPVGRPWEELGRIATAYEADAIVVGRHGARSTAFTHLGSTAENVARSAAVPVLLVTGPRDVAPRRILVALDESDSVGVVAGWAALLGRREGVRVTALHVVSAGVLERVLATAGGTTASGNAGTGNGAEATTAYLRDTDRWIERVVGAGLPRERVTSEVAFGEPGQRILEAVEREHCELVVLGAHGGGVLRRMFVGSVASEVLRGARCPVLVVPVPEDEIVS